MPVSKETPELMFWLSEASIRSKEGAGEINEQATEVLAGFGLATTEGAPPMELKAVPPEGERFEVRIPKHLSGDFPNFKLFRWEGSARVLVGAGKVKAASCPSEGLIALEVEYEQIPQGFLVRCRRPGFKEADIPAWIGKDQRVAQSDDQSDGPPPNALTEGEAVSPLPSLEVPSPPSPPSDNEKDEPSSRGNKMGSDIPTESKTPRGQEEQGGTAFASAHPESPTRDSPPPVRKTQVRRHHRPHTPHTPAPRRQKPPRTSHPRKRVISREARRSAKKEKKGSSLMDEVEAEARRIGLSIQPPFGVWLRLVGSLEGRELQSVLGWLRGSKRSVKRFVRKVVEIVKD